MDPPRFTSILGVLRGSIVRSGDGVRPADTDPKYRQKLRLAMKVRASVRRICENCKIVRRKGIVRVVCTNTKHKQKQG